MALKIDRRVGGSFFFLSSPLELPAIRLEGILLLTPSLVGLLLQYTRNPQQTGRKQKRSSTHRRSPATNKVVEILILGTYLLLDCSFDYLRASPSNSRDTPLWSYDFAFLEKALKKWRKLPPHRNKRPKTKNKRTFLESIWLCHVASHTAAQQTILPTWLGNVVSRIDVAAAASISRHAGHTCFCSRHMQSWTWRQNQSARNLNNFCRAPFRISGHIRWPITPLFFGIFLSFFHSMLSFHYFTSMRGKNLKVLCFKTAIWRTLKYTFTCFSFRQDPSNELFDRRDFFTPWYRKLARKLLWKPKMVLPKLLACIGFCRKSRTTLVISPFLLACMKFSPEQLGASTQNMEGLFIMSVATKPLFRVLHICPKT